MNIPGFGGNIAVVGGAIVAAIVAALALLFGGSFLIQGAPQSLSSAQNQSASAGSQTAGGDTTGGDTTGDSTSGGTKGDGSGDSDGSAVGTPRSGNTPAVVLPDGAVAADQATAEQLLQGGLEGVTFSGQTIDVFKDTNRLANNGFPLYANGSDGCNNIGSHAQIANDGTLQFADDRVISSADCAEIPGIEEFRQVFRTGATIYTHGERVFLKHGNKVLEFVRV